MSAVKTWQLVAALGLMLSLGAAQATALAPYEPERGCYIGAYIELDEESSGDLDSFEKATGKVHATYFRYLGYGQAFPYEWVAQLAKRGAAAHIAWEPNDGLAQVKDDEYLHGWAQAARKAGCPIFLRYASEMNGNWQAYSGNPAEYIAKWRLVYRVMHEEAPNVIMVWCPYATPRATIPQFYPGDEYVDWVGVNIYSVLHEDGELTKPASEDPRSLLRYVYDLFAYRKPIAICEYAASHYCKAAQADATDFALDNMGKLYASLATDFPRVRMINWFSVDTVKTGLANNNYSLLANPRVLDTYAHLVNSDYFLSQVAAAKPLSTSVVAAPPLPSATTVTPVTPAPATSAAPSQPIVSHSLVPLASTKIGIVGAKGVAIVLQGAPPAAVRGRVEVLADVSRQVTGDTATFYIDGRFTAMTNVSPYRFTLEADRLDPGEHILKVEVGSYGENAVATCEARIIVAKPTG